MEQFSGERTGQCRILIGVVGLIAFQHHRPDGLQVGILPRERAHDEELVALHDIGIVGILHFPLQLHGSGIGEHAMRVESEHLSREVARIVHRLVVFYLMSQYSEAVDQCRVQFEVLVLLSGRNHDEAGEGVFRKRGAGDGLCVAVLVGIGAADPCHGLSARERYLQHAFFALIRSWHNVVGLEFHVGQRHAAFGYHLIV